MKKAFLLISVFCLLPQLIGGFFLQILTVCPGDCMKNTTACRANGGKILAYCTNGRACCDYSFKKTGTCGDKKSGLNDAIFQSPSYPDYDSGDSVCIFDFELKPDFQGIAIEFVDVYTEGKGFYPHSMCDTDMVFLKGFAFWQPPPRCGNLTGYIAFIDKSINTGKMKTLSIVAVMSSKRYKWKIRISYHNIQDIMSKQSNDPSKNDNELTAEPFDNPEINKLRHTGSPQQPGIPITGQSTRSIHNILIDKDPMGISFGENTDFNEVLEPLVVNGEDTPIADVPWQASLRQVYPESILKIIKQRKKLAKSETNCTEQGRHFCGGSIVDTQDVTTVNKFLGWLTLEEVKVFLGDTNLCLDDGVKYGQPAQSYSIQNVIFNYAYDGVNMLQNDILIIKLKEKINFTDYIKPIALSKQNKNYEGRKAKVSGWGLTNLTTPVGGELPFILQSTNEIYIENQTKCHNYLNRGFSVPSKFYVERFPKYKFMYESVLCTTYKNGTEMKLVGQGDSGGPLIVLDEEGQPVQIGIVSYMLPVLKAKSIHDNVYVDFFGDVSFYRNWIDLAMMI